MSARSAVRAPRANVGAPRGNVGAPRRDRIDALLALAGDADSDAAAGRLRWLRRFLLCWSAARSIVWTTVDPASDPTFLRLATAVLVIAAGLAFVPRYETSASRVALPALLVELGTTFPLTPNHFFLELYAVTLLALAEPDGRDDALVLHGLRWLVAIVLFLTGCQKLAFGQYWTGDFLAFMVGRGDRFAALFQWVLSPAEVARLQSYDPFRGGAGPYRVATPLFLLLANLVWVAEILLPIGLLARATRPVAVWAAVAFVLAIQLGARELGFALVFVNLLLLLAPARAARAAATGSIAIAAAVAVAALGLSSGGSRDPRLASLVKRRAVVALLLGVALWPLGQRWLVARYHVDPWKLASFAMYATPNLPPVVLAVTGGPAGITPLDERTLPAWTRQQFDRFRVERSALGLLREPADVGRALLLARPELPDVAILVQRSTLDRRSALIAVVTDRYVYRRADLVD